MYSRFIAILKFLQLLGYVLAIIVAIVYASLPYSVLYFPFFGFYGRFFGFAALLCCWNYIVTQTLIAIIDLLNQIEINTRNLRR